MKQCCCMILLCLLVVSVAAAPVSGGAEEGFPAAVALEAVHEFAPVIEGSDVDHDFVIRNDGEAPLDILAVRSG